MVQLYIVPKEYVRAAYKPALSSPLRLFQIDAVYGLMKDGHWRTLEQISKQLKQPIQSVSARLRDLRKDKFGGFTVRREMSDKPRVWLYKVED